MKQFIFVLFFMALAAWPLASRERHRKRRPPPAHSSSGCQTGQASWYGPGRNCLGCPHGGTRTANGERFTGKDMTAAHKTLPFGTMVRVRHRGNGRMIVVRINDRGPYVRGRIIDLSRAAARALMGNAGTASVEICWGAK